MFIPVHLRSGYLHFSSSKSSSVFITVHLPSGYLHFPSCQCLAVFITVYLVVTVHLPSGYLHFPSSPMNIGEHRWTSMFAMFSEHQCSGCAAWCRGEGFIDQTSLTLFLHIKFFQYIRDHIRVFEDFLWNVPEQKISLKLIEETTI